MPVTNRWGRERKIAKGYTDTISKPPFSVESGGLPVYVCV
jgi:hypothetical protein